MHYPKVRGTVENHWSDQGGHWNDTPSVCTVQSYTVIQMVLRKGICTSGLLRFPVFLKSLSLSTCFGWVWGRDPHRLPAGNIERCRLRGLGKGEEGLQVQGGGVRPALLPCLAGCPHHHFQQHRNKNRAFPEIHRTSDYFPLKTLLTCVHGQEQQTDILSSPGYLF